MVGQQGVNAHTAADLLRQAMMQRCVTAIQRSRLAASTNSFPPPPLATAKQLAGSWQVEVV